MAKSAFQSAAEGSSSGKPKNTVSKSKYQQAIDKVTRIKTGAKKLAAKSEKVIDLTGHAVAVGAGAYGAGFARGRLGNKLAIMGKNPLPAVGIIATAVGIGLQVSGKRVGGYVSGLGEGVFAAWAAEAGATMGQKNAQAAGSDVTQAPPAPALPGAAPAIAGHREILLGEIADAPLGPEPLVGMTRSGEERPAKLKPAFVRVRAR